MKFKLSTIILCCFINLKSYAQNQTDNWYFGNKAGLNFSNCNPTILTDGQLNTIEGVATISDANGNLLFYSDGVTIWNKQHLIMANGTGLLGDASSTQSAVIVPKPGNPSLYYIFTPAVQGSNNGLTYSIVNITLNGGLGEVIEKNTLLQSNIIEKVTAVRHANSIDVWVVSRVYNSNEYKSWLVSSTGIAAAVTSLSPFNPGPTYQKWLGYLKTSSDGKTIFCAFTANNYSEVARFNNQTGVVSNVMKFNNVPNYTYGTYKPGAYGVEFSPGGRYMYVSTTLENQNGYLSQFDLSVFDSAAIANSVVYIDSGRSVVNTEDIGYGALQLAKNGKIYIAEYLSYYLGVINNPDLPGNLINFQLYGQHLNSKRSLFGLPTFIQSYFDPHFRTFNFNSSEDCNLNVSFDLITTDTYDSLRWDFGDAGSGPQNTSVIPVTNHQYSAAGPKTIKLVLYNTFGCGVITDTVIRIVNVGINAPDLGNDTTLCAGQKIILNALTNNAVSYLWNTGANSNSIEVSDPGLYWSEVSVGACIIRDSIIISSKPYPLVNLGDDIILCQGNTSIFNVDNPGASYLWQDGSTLNNYSATTAGTYHVEVNLNGCVAKDTISVAVLKKPIFTLGEDKGICEGELIKLQPMVQGDWQFMWNTGSTENTIDVTNPGTYFLTATNDCGSTTDAIVITRGICSIYVPSAFTPNNDGNNDYFKILGTGSIDFFHLLVFNRYGQIVFESQKRNDGWNGFYNSVPAEVGTYVYILKLREINSSKVEQIKGTFLLLR